MRADSCPHTIAKTYTQAQLYAMALSIWDPITDMERTMRSLTPTFGREFGIAPFMGAPLPPTTVATHAFDVQETENAYNLITDAPGMTPEDIKVELNNDTLVVSGEKKTEARQKREEGGVRMHRHERTFTRFSRSFILPDDVDVDKINARMDAGVLNVEIPKVPKEQRRSEPKRIKVAGGGGGGRIGAAEPSGPSS